MLACVDSAMTAWPVMPRATEPRATKRGMSAAGRNTLQASGRQRRVVIGLTGLWDDFERVRRRGGVLGCI